MKLWPDCRHPVEDSWDFCFECWLLNSVHRSRVPRHVRDPDTIAKVLALLAATPSPRSTSQTRTPT